MPSPVTGAPGSASQPCPSQTWVIQHCTFSSWLFCFSLLQEEEVDSENEKLVVREPEDEDGECQASQNFAGRL